MTVSIAAFRVNNKTIDRKELTIDEIKEETLTILEQGHKRILILLGETREKDFLDYLIEAIHTVYSVRDSKGSYIRRINIEIAPLSEEGFQK
jgi:2-iminoacetate synthase